MDALVVDAITTRVATGFALLPDRGTVAENLTHLARDVRDRLLSPEVVALLRVLVARMTHSEALAVYAREFWPSQVRIWVDVVESAVQRGELPRGVDAEAVAAAIYGPLYLGALMDDPLDDDLIDRVIKSSLT